MARAARDLPHPPSMDQLLRAPAAARLLELHGREPTKAALRTLIEEGRREQGLYDEARRRLEAGALPSQRPVLNLTGTVLHTNLGRALIAEEAIAAAVTAMAEPTALEFDLETGRRGERDHHVEELLCRVTGAQAATVVNNNAAAVLLVLDSLGRRKEAVVSRGELIEIGGSFRMPDIMARAGCRLVEVGTTNRTHLRDYADAIGPRTGLLMKVHTSNYEVKGFTHAVAAGDLAPLAREHGLPLVEDLGSGTLVDLAAHGLRREPTVREAVAAGVDLVTFSGDKLLGGPQAGIVAGSKALVQRLNRNPLKRALRMDKIRLAILEATLRLYADPGRLAQRLPTLRLLTRPEAEIAAAARVVLPHLAAALGSGWRCEVTLTKSQIGSGALPLATLPSAALAVRPEGRGSGRRLAALAAALRRLPRPVIGRVAEGALLLDLRCLTTPDALIAELAHLAHAPA